jgi:hypothetical protein
VRVVRWILILLGFGLVGGGIYFIVDRPPGGIEALIPAGLLFFFAILMFTVWLPMFTRTDHGKLLRTGEPATATIVEVTDTGGTINQQPIFKFTLDIRRRDGSTYRTTIRQIVSRTAQGAIRPGMTVPVRVDPDRPTKAAIDSAGNLHDAARPLVGLAPTGLPPASLPASGRALMAADVIRDGIRATATVQSVQLTGQTFGQQWPDRADPSTAADPLVVMTMDVTAADGSTFGAQGIYRVPKDRLPRLALGATLPVAYLPADPSNTACVDWDRL